jgi:hypothetical protein
MSGHLIRKRISGSQLWYFYVLTEQQQQYSKFTEKIIEIKQIVVNQKAGFAKLHVGLMVLVKRMSVLINFLLQNTKLVSVLGKNLPKFCWSCLTGLTQVANSEKAK